MSQIDWSKAPEGATHYCDLVGGFVKFEGERVSLLDRLNTGKVWCRPVSIAFDLVSSLMPRPWTGEGMPPVGTVCEFRVEEGDWRQCEVIAHKAETAVCWIHCNKILSTGGASVRPIRTPEQIAAEVREKDCKEMLAIIKASPWGMTAGPHEVIALLYDADYRKFEIVDE